MNSMNVIDIITVHVTLIYVYICIHIHMMNCLGVTRSKDVDVSMI